MSKNENEGTTRRDWLKALGLIGITYPAFIGTARAAHNSDAPYPNGAWGYNSIAIGDTDTLPSITDIDNAWSETYHLKALDIPTGARYYSEKGDTAWDLLPIVWAGLDTPADADVPAGGVMVEQDESASAFRLLGIDDDASHFREATVAWTESLFPGDPLDWETAADWDAAQSETGVHHEQPDGTDWEPASTIEKGYPTTDQNGSNLLAYWPLEEDSGTTANDVSGNNEDGNVTGATLNTTPAPFSHSAYDLDGTDDDVTITTSNVPAGESSDEITLSLWVNADNLGASGTKRRIFSREGSKWFLSTEGNALKLRTFGGNTGGDFPGLTADTWQHVVLIWDCGTDATLVLDGDNGSTSNITDTSSGAGDSTIGDSGSDVHFDGSVAHVRVYDRLLTVSEAQDLHAAAVGESEYWSSKQVAVGTNSTITVTTDTTIPTGTSIDLHLFEDVGNDDTGAGTDALGNNYDNTDNANLTAGNDQTVDLTGFDGGGTTNAYWLHLEPDVTNNDPTTEGPTIERVQIGQ